MAELNNTSFLGLPGCVCSREPDPLCIRESSLRCDLGATDSRIDAIEFAPSGRPADSRGERTAMLPDRNGGGVMAVVEKLRRRVGVDRPQPPPLWLAFAGFLTLPV